MITTTLVRARRHTRARRGFSLVELIVAAGLGSVILVAVLSSFLFVGRTTVALTNYTDMETEARNAIETFAQDVRMSANVLWNSANSVTLTIRQSGSSTTATYAYDPVNRRFTRTATGTTRILISNISDFSFTAYNIDSDALSLASITASTHLATKQIQIALETERANPGLVRNTNKVISARFVLRNKHVGV